MPLLVLGGGVDGTQDEYGLKKYPLARAKVIEKLRAKEFGKVACRVS